MGFFWIFNIFCISLIFLNLSEFWKYFLGVFGFYLDFLKNCFGFLKIVLIFHVFLIFWNSFCISFNFFDLLGFLQNCFEFFEYFRIFSGIFNFFGFFEKQNLLGQFFFEFFWFIGIFNIFFEFFLIFDFCDFFWKTFGSIRNVFRWSSTAVRFGSIRRVFRRSSIVRRNVCGERVREREREFVVRVHQSVFRWLWFNDIMTRHVTTRRGSVSFETEPRRARDVSVDPVRSWAFPGGSLSHSPQLSRSLSLAPSLPLAHALSTPLSRPRAVSALSRFLPALSLFFRYFWTFWDFLKFSDIWIFFSIF